MTQKSDASRIYFIVYLVAILCSALSLKYIFLSESVLLNVFYADLVGALIVFLACVYYNNVSIYDPYWTVQVTCISVFYFIQWKNKYFKGTLEMEGYEWRAMIVFFLVNLWSVRLTSNLFINSVDNIEHEDWRYSDYRSKTPNKFAYFVVSIYFYYIVYSKCAKSWTALNVRLFFENIFIFSF